MINRLILIGIITMLISCNETKSTLVENELLGDYYTLDKDNIDLFLPLNFRVFSEDEYDKVINEMPPSESKNIERQYFNYLKYSKGNIYYYKDVSSSTLIGVKMSEYIDFTKEESSYLLSMMSNTCSSYAEKVNMYCEKISAGFSGLSKTKVFKATYKISNENGYSNFNTMYIITSNNKTFSINIFSTNNTNYNSYIEKIVVR
nr:hypothetical protein [uncultured Psychroserpens sp.]